MTTWINIDKFKPINNSIRPSGEEFKSLSVNNQEEYESADADSILHWFTDKHFSAKEGFTNKQSNKNPLEIFLKANPLKSIFDREIIDTRNATEGFAEVNPIEDPDNNIKPLREEEEELNPLANETPAEPDNERTRNRKKKDAKLIETIIISLVSLFISLYISYNWIFNFTEGFTQRIQVYEKFDVVNYLYFFSEYFYKIVKFVDETVSIKIPGLVKAREEKRTIFILIFIIATYVVKSVISFLMRLYKIIKTFVETRKINIAKLIYDPKNNNLYISLLFVFFVIEGIISSLKSGLTTKAAKDLGAGLGELGDKLGDKLSESSGITETIHSASDPSESFKEALTSFKIANPLKYILILLIRIAIVYGPTIALSSSLVFFYLNFYSLYGIPYYMNATNSQEGFIDMFRNIHANLNSGYAFFQTAEPNTVSDYFEKFSKGVFKYLPFMIMFSGIFTGILSTLKFHSSVYKWTGISLLSLLGLGIFSFMVGEIYR